MAVTRKQVRKVLNQKIVQLNDIIADIDGLLTNLETDYFRVSIFGSARIQTDSESFQQVYELAYQLAMRGVDIVTGGGPGLMQAANKGAKDGGKQSRSIGLSITLPFESDTNSHLDVKRNHRRFSSRLDEFMRISHAVVVTPGGIGTLLELLYTWQLIQVDHIKSRPILLLGGGKMWEELLAWMRKWPLTMNLLGEKDMLHLVVCDSVDEVLTHIEPEMAAFRLNQTHQQTELEEMD
jgi:uncharacterized protein (TIGR00730 family)